MNALPRETHLFRQSNKTKFCTNPDVKCFQSFISSLQIFEAIIPQHLLYERCANINCSKMPSNYLLPNCTTMYLQTARKKRYNLTQNYSVGSDLTEHNRWLQKTISHSYFVSDVSQLLIRKRIRASRQVVLSLPTPSWLLLSTVLRTFRVGGYICIVVFRLVRVDHFTKNFFNCFWSSLVFWEPSHSGSKFCSLLVDHLKSISLLRYFVLQSNFISSYVMRNTWITIPYLFSSRNEWYYRPISCHFFPN